jgi:ABC transporter substrate binding protein
MSWSPGLLVAPTRADRDVAIRSLSGATQTSRKRQAAAGFRSEVRLSEDIAPAIEPLKGRAETLYVCLDPLAYSNAARINALALAARLPVIHSIRESPLTGGLLSYGPDFPDMSRRAAELVDKILRGAKPTKFDLVITQKRQSARPHRAGNSARPRRRGDRITVMFAAVHESGCDVVDGARSRQRAPIG